jgi:hypothetical protein
MTVETIEQSKMARWVVGRPSNIALLYAARAARGFGDGFAAIILPAYLTEAAWAGASQSADGGDR